MNSERKKIRRIFQVMLYLGLGSMTAFPVHAQVPVDEYGDPIPPLVEGATIAEMDGGELPKLSAGELEDLVGPVALYPDDLIAIVLPASTYPLQIVQAARFLEQLETDPSLKPDEDWDDSITALLNYPEVVELMNEDIDWTWRLGEAVVAQQADVVSAIETFRDRAYAAGNLKSDEYQTVSSEDGVIEIEPASEDVIYVPYYEPASVVVYQPQPVYYYHPRPYPLYYYPYPYGYPFASNFFWGVTTAFTIGWMTDHLHVYHPTYWGHPYYGHHYHSHYYYRRPSLSVFNRYYVDNSHRYSDHRHRDGDYWRPRHHGGARPGHDRYTVNYYRDSSRDDSRHGGGGSHHDRQADDRYHGNNTGDRLPANRRGNSDRNTGFQAGNRGRGNPADRRNSFSSSDRDSLRLRERDTSIRADAERRRTRNTEELNSGSTVRTTFAANPKNSPADNGNWRSSTPATNRAHTTRTAGPNMRDGSNTTHGTSTRAAIERSKYTAMNNPGRHVPPSPARQVSPTRGSAAVRPTGHSTQPVATRSHSQRSAPAPRRAVPPSAPQRSATPALRAGSRAQRASSGASFRRGESRSKRR
jgi:hypothetical protein